jgi:diaminopropionate ammonia-lyase
VRTGPAPGVYQNPRATGTWQAQGEPVGVRSFHQELPGYGVTPLIDAPGIAVALGVESVNVKDESQRLGMPSFKILGASWATYRAICAAAGLDPQEVRGLTELGAAVHDSGMRLVAATDGNHGRAVARMGRLIGLASYILVPRDMVPARIAAIEGEGAVVEIVDGTYDDAVAASAALADTASIVVSDTSWPGYQTVPGWVIDGYATMGEEILEQLAAGGRGAPTVVAAQIGVGAFAASVVRAFVPRGARVIGVEPVDAACAQASAIAGEPVSIGSSLASIMAGLNCGMPSPLAWPELIDGVDAFVAVEDGAAEEAMRVLAGAGVVSGESGAAGLAGLLAYGDELSLGAADRVLLVSTEGATDPVAYDRIVGEPG